VPDATDIPALRYRYQTLEVGALDIHVRTLRDRQQFSDVDRQAEILGVSPASWGLFGVVWDSSQVLAHLMLEQEVVGQRILEVGCGIGLASLVLNERHADITATDHHPEAGHFLKTNVGLNNGRPIPFVRASWSDSMSDLGCFDIIIGSDLLYEPDHVNQLSAFIVQHSKPDCSVIIVDPGRFLHTRFSKRMVELGFVFCMSNPLHTRYLVEPFKGKILSYRRQLQPES